MQCVYIGMQSQQNRHTTQSVATIFLIVMTPTSEHAVTVLISRQVKQGCEAEFELGAKVTKAEHLGRSDLPRDWGVRIGDTETADRFKALAFAHAARSKVSFHK